MKNRTDAIKDRDVTAFYQDGYNNGYDWLKSGRWNFVHPMERRTFANGRELDGYVPGGPILDDTDPFHGAARSAWIQGWKDGINTYVEKHNLPFGKVEGEVVYNKRVVTVWDELWPILEVAIRAEKEV